MGDEKNLGDDEGLRPSRAEAGGGGGSGFGVGVVILHPAVRDAQKLIQDFFKVNGGEKRPLKVQLFKAKGYGLIAHSLAIALRGPYCVII